MYSAIYAHEGVLYGVREGVSEPTTIGMAFMVDTPSMFEDEESGFASLLSIGFDNVVQLGGGPLPIGLLRKVIGGAAARTATWKSKIANNAERRPFAWGRLDSEVSVSAVVRLIKDGVLWHEATVSSGEPFRLPPGRPRELEIEVESSAQFPQLVLASSLAEMP
jgi:hypothetical protein